MKQAILDPIKVSGVTLINIWHPWLAFHDVAKLTPSGSTTFGITDADILVNRKILNDLFEDQSTRSPIEIDDNAAWSVSSVRNDVIAAAVSKDIEIANSIRSG
jgi:hypothetical protein